MAVGNQAIAQPGCPRLAPSGRMHYICNRQILDGLRQQSYPVEQTLLRWHLCGQVTDLLKCFLNARLVTAGHFLPVITSIDAGVMKLLFSLGYNASHRADSAGQRVVVLTPRQRCARKITERLRLCHSCISIMTTPLS